MTDSHPIPFIDLRAQLARIRPEVDAAIERVLSSAAFVGGPDVAALEREFADYCGAAHACAVANGTDALQLALRAYGIGAGRRGRDRGQHLHRHGEAVLLSGRGRCSWTWRRRRARWTLPARGCDHAAHEARAAGAPLRPSGRHDRDRRHRRTPRPAACSRTRPRRTAPRWRTSGPARSAHAACFSFYPTKNLGAFGDAGMVTSSDAGLHRPRAADRQPRRGGRSLRQRARRHQLPSRHPAGRGAAREARPARALERRARGAGAPLLERPQRRAGSGAAAGAEGGASSAWHLYTVRYAERDALAAHLRARGIGTAVRYPRPIHLQPAMAAAGGKSGELPVSERLSREVLCLPLYAELRSVRRGAGRG